MSVGLHEVRFAHTWSTTDKDSSFTLSNANLTITGGGGGSGSFVSGRCNRRMAKNQLIYCEFTLSNFTSGVAIGISNTAAPLSNYLGSDTNAVTAYFSAPGSAGVFSYNNAQSGTPGTAAANGAVVGMAVDCVNRKIWIRIQTTGNWNNAAIGSQNPATNLGGFSCPGVFTGTGNLMLGVSSNATSSVVIVNPGPTFSGTPPAGFRAPNSMVNVA